MDFNPFEHKISDLNNHSAQKGKVLLAEPFMQDPYFKRSVVLLCEHAPEGSVGFILNHEMSLKINEVIDDFPDFNVPVFLGGPVKPENLFFLHQMKDLPGSIRITEGLYWSGDFEVLKARIERKEVKTNQIRFFLGYSGWDNEQLSMEIEQQSWIIHRLEVHTFFNTPVNSPG